MTGRPKCSDIPLAEILGAVEAFHSGGRLYPDEQLAGKYPFKVVVAKLEKLVGRGFLDCGTTIRGAFLTDAGREALRRARESPPSNAPETT